MAEGDIDPEDREKIRIELSSKLKYYFLGIVGVAALVTVYLVFAGGSGSLFKGFIGEAPPNIDDVLFPPTVVSFTPANLSTDIPVDAGSVTVTFDEAGLNMIASVDATIIGAGSTTDKESGAASYSETTKTLTINYSELEGETVYTVTVPAEKIVTPATDPANNEPMDSDLVWTFTTREAPLPIPPTGDDTGDDDDDDDDVIIPPTSGDDDDDDDTEEEVIEILDHDVFPGTFNPVTNETKISYEISADATVEIKIIDHTGITILTLLDDEDLEAGDYYVWWNGTDKKDSEGEVIAAGVYTYKIHAKDSEGNVKDIKSGKINAVYSAAQIEDFEDLDTGPTESVQADPDPVVQPVQTTTQPTQAAAATVSLQSAQTGVTAGTGTPALIYLLFPLGGYFISRKKK